jgi:hypothetical protein
VLDPRAIALGGIGYGPVSLATLGLWSGDEDSGVSPPSTPGITILLPKYKPLRKPGRPIEEDEALLLAVLH